ncbi:hypothetical protein SLS59_010099, partial [Nothophoma quercina]
MPLHTNADQERVQINKIGVTVDPVELHQLAGTQYDPQRLTETHDHARLDFNSAAYKIPWKYKILALICVVSLPIGHDWTGASLGPLKNTLRNELGITNTQFGVISASDAIVKSIWPIIGGIPHHFGPNIIVLCCTGIVFVGSIFAGVAVSLGLWRLLAGGHIFMGFGIAILDSATQKFFYHWFGAGGLALAFGLESAVSRTVDLV